MTSVCDDVQLRLARESLATLQRADFKELIDHCQQCERCGEFLRQMTELDQELERLPQLAAPPSLVARTLQAVRRTDPDVPPTTADFSGQRRWALALGSAASLLAAVHLLAIAPDFDTSTVSSLAPAADRNEVFAIDTAGSKQAEPEAVAKVDNAPARRANRDDSREQLQAAVAEEADLVAAEATQVPAPAVAPLPVPASPVSVESEVAAEPAEMQPRVAEFDDGRGVGGEQQEMVLSTVAASPSVALSDAAAGDASSETLRDLPARAAQLAARSKEAPAAATASETVASDKRRLVSQDRYRADADAFRRGDDEEVTAAELRDRMQQALQRPAGKRQTAPADSQHSQLAFSEKKANQQRAAGVSRQMPGLASGRSVLDGDAGPAVAAAERYLSRREALGNLQFQPATGYWENTYLPGDPAMRRLQSRLRSWNRSALRSLANVDPGLEQGIMPAEQPFDPPRDAALGLYLHADKAALNGPARVRLQVGIRAADRRGGQRTAMNVAVVLDRRGLAAPTVSDQPTIRAILRALMQAKQPGDRLTLTLAGAGGGLLLNADQFRHGPLSVALRRLPGSAATAEPTTLPEAIATAADSIRAVGDGAEAEPLGASLILLLATAPIAAELAELERQAHRNAVAGINLSAMAVANRVEPAAIRRLVLAGQGRLRSVADPAAAQAQVERELYASSRAVARALRLRIQLAPGVKLVEVLGSQRLAEPQAERVREAEKSIDLRLARNLGIRADRGDDEDGIQIVIPSFDANDRHVILLDVVAPGAGPLADVALRYKDLVFLRNGVASARLDLPTGEDHPGALQHNVMLNALSQHLAQTATSASELLAAGDAAQAIDNLVAFKLLLQGLRQLTPGWQDHPMLANEQRLLADYLSVLRTPAIGNAELRNGLADSLRYAAYRKLQGKELAP